MTPRLAVTSHKPTPKTHGPGSGPGNVFTETLHYLPPVSGPKGARL